MEEANLAINSFTGKENADPIDQAN